jgi:hypothetical protein
MSGHEALVHTIEEATGAEHIMSVCYSRIAALVKNGRVRAKLESFAAMAQANEDELIERFKCCVADKYLIEKKCKFCTVEPESFSLHGAINLGVEILETSIHLYRELAKKCEPEEDSELFKGLLEEKIKQKDFLMKEKKYTRVDQDTLDFVDTYCLPEVISKLWT